MVRVSRNSSASLSLRRESVVVSQSKARALLRIGWFIKCESASHKILSRPGWPDLVFAFHDRDEIGPKMLARETYVTQTKRLVTAHVQHFRRLQERFLDNPLMPNRMVFALFTARRCGRVAEGGGLLNR
jgi:predicted RNA binding protein YcfA (HicA-like mRNA interferase family)